MVLVLTITESRKGRSFMNVKKNTTAEIMVDAERCSGCGLCQLQCSFSKLGVFNPSQAYIMIDWVDDEPMINFTDDCDVCGICVRSCVYGALTLVK